MCIVQSVTGHARRQERKSREELLLRDSQETEGGREKRETQRTSVKIATGFTSAEIKAALCCFLFCCCSEVFRDTFLPVKSEEGDVAGVAGLKCGWHFF